MNSVAARLSLFILFLSWIQAVGASLFSDLQVNEKNGTFNLSGLEFNIVHVSENWKRSTLDRSFKPDAGFPKKENQLIEERGTFDTAAGSYTLVERLQADADGVRFHAELEGVPASKTKRLFLETRLLTDDFKGAELIIDGAKVLLPVESDRVVIFNRDRVESCIVSMDDAAIQITGAFKLIIQDDREVNEKFKHYTLMFFFDPNEGALRSAALDLTFSPVRFPMHPLDLSHSANMGFADETVGDRTGGWTDQGAQQDLRALQGGPLTVGHISFEVLDPQQNDGKSCVMFAGGGRPYFLEKAAVPADGTHEALYLLHAAAWAPHKAGVSAGTVTVHYQDGDESSFTIQTDRDINDWCAPASVENGKVAWTAETPSTFIGLYASRFELKPKPIRDIALAGSGKMVWGVVAMTLGADVELPRDTEEYITENADWKPFHYSLSSTEHSVMDFSWASDAPAGKHGRLISTNGQLEFDGNPGVPVRFYGCNLVFDANFPETPEAAGQLADVLVRQGYNAVRIHHYDALLTKNSAVNSYTFDPEMLDRLDGLFAAMKKRGLYCVTDFYTIRRFTPEEVPEYGKMATESSVKALIPLFDSALSSWKKFAGNLLTHTNAYTGLAWKDDPALLLVCPVNENNLTKMYKHNPEIRELWIREFERAKADELAAGENRDALFTRFLIDRHNQSQAAMTEYIRSLGCDVLISGANFHTEMSVVPMRSKLDVAENHGYWAHPSSFRPPAGLSQQNPVAAFDSLYPMTRMASRIFGKPYAITEFNYCTPNHERAAGGLLMGSYAGLQDWDALFRFNYTRFPDPKYIREPHEQAHFFDAAGDPITLCADRMTELLFLRGDVSPASTKAAFAVPDKTADESRETSYPLSFQQLGLSVQIGSVDVGGTNQIDQDLTVVTAIDPIPAANLNGRTVTSVEKLVEEHRGLVNPDTQTARSQTGELFLDAGRELFKVVTPKSEGFALSGKADVRGNVVQAQNLDSKPCVTFVSAMDGKNIADSGRLLVFLLTDTLGSKTKFGNAQHTELLEWGGLPHLVRKGKARVSIQTDKTLKLWAIDLSGNRKEELPVTKTDLGATFEVSTFCKSGTYLAFELEEE